MNKTNQILEFNQIVHILQECTVTEAAKRRFEELSPFMEERLLKEKLKETSEARKLLDSYGTPPFAEVGKVRQRVQEAEQGSLLGLEDLEEIRRFCVMCGRLNRYLKKCKETDSMLACYADGIQESGNLREEIERCIRGGRVDDDASRELRCVRQKKEQIQAAIQQKLESILKTHRQYFSENFVSNRNGHYTLPVKKEYKFQVNGSVIDISSTGATCFIEPAAVSKLRAELDELVIQEENEEKVILYTLSSLAGDQKEVIWLNLDYIEELDYIFAKGKLSTQMQAAEPQINTQRRINLKDARHPLIPAKECVPLNITFGSSLKGVIITGPNTGGKTVALKTIGLLSLMAQCGLHIPCIEADICMNSAVFCDIGDGQSISENLSTFSAHISNIIRILDRVDAESLVLLDELGSGTDPAEGMGLAVAILESLREKGCNFVATTHYPEVKEYASAAPGVENARMAFDRESLKPLYRLELGEAGESCAFYIAKRLGMSRELLERANKAAYGQLNGEKKEQSAWLTEIQPVKTEQTKSTIKQDHGDRQTDKDRRARLQAKYSLGDSVMVYPQKKLGIVFAPANEKGEVGVQIAGRKSLVSHKRLNIQVKAKEMYPEDYDFSVVFDTVEKRKAEHRMARKYVQGLEVHHEDLEWKN